MAKLICAKRHFGKGGDLIPVGAEADGKADGEYWVEKGASQPQQPKKAEKSAKD